MVKFTEKMSPEEIEDAMFGMTCLRDFKTEIGYEVWLDYYGSTKKISPRVLIDFDGHCGDMIPISIDKFNPKVLVDREVPGFEKITDWIKKNYSVLIRHWNQEIDDFEVIFLLYDDFRDVTKNVQFWKLHKIKNLKDLMIYPLLVKYWGQQKVNEVQALLNESEVD